MNLHWQAKASVGCFHTVNILMQGFAATTLQPPTLAERMLPILDRFGQWLETANLSPQVACLNLIPMAGMVEGNTMLARRFCQRLAPKFIEVDQQHLAAYFSDLERCFQEAFPNWQQTLNPATSLWIQDQWRQSGDLLLRRIANATDDSLLVDEARVYVVPPVLGGAGEAFLSYNAVTIESVQSNMKPNLPEVWRLAWLLSLLNLDLPKFSDELDRDERELLARLAMIPPTINAGQENADVNSIDPEFLAEVIQYWVPWFEDPEAIAASLSRWWDTYIDRKPNFEIALLGLSKVIKP